MTVARVPKPSVLWQANKAPLRGTVAQCHSPPSLVNEVINETRFWDNKAVVQFVSPLFLSLSPAFLKDTNDQFAYAGHGLLASGS